MSFEFRSKAQFRMYLKQLVSRGKLNADKVDEMVESVDLPDYVGLRKGGTRKQLGGLRANSRRGGIRKGGVR